MHVCKYRGRKYSLQGGVNKHKKFKEIKGGVYKFWRDHANPWLRPCTFDKDEKSLDE